jgi:hypothetical protein
VWVQIDGLAEVSVARTILRQVLDAGSSCKPEGLPTPEALCGLVDGAEELADRELSATMHRILSQEENRVRPRVAELTERYERRIARASLRVSGMRTDEKSDERAAKRLKNARDYHRRLERELREKTEELSRLPEPEAEVSIVGASWVEFR